MRTCEYDNCTNKYYAKGYCSKHYTRVIRHGDPAIYRVTPPTPSQRFWARVNKYGPCSPPAIGVCWIWEGRKNPDGYGCFDYEHTPVLAHRFSFTEVYGDVPEGLQLDHLCRVRHCVNPSHLEAVPQLENVRRGLAGQHYRMITQCPRGHSYDEGNTVHTAQGKRYCRACRQGKQRIYDARYAQKIKALAS